MLWERRGDWLGGWKMGVMLWGVIEEFNAISNGLIVMRVRRVIGAAWGLWRLKTIRVQIPVLIITIIRRRRRRRRFWGEEEEAREDFSEAIKQLHCFFWGRGFNEWRNEKACSQNYFVCVWELCCAFNSLTTPGSATLWWMSFGFYYIFYH